METVTDTISGNEERLKRLIQGITPPDETARAQAKAQWDGLAKPLGSLGWFEAAVEKLAALQGSAGVHTEASCLVVFCADNGVVAQGVTQCGSEVTANVAVALAENRSSVSPMAAAAGCRVLPVDVGIRNFAGHPGVKNLRIRNGTEDICSGPAMSREDCLAAILAGADLAPQLAAEGTDILLSGEMGIGNTTTAAAAAAALLGLEPEAAVGRGAGLSDKGLLRKQNAVREALRRNRPDRKDPIDVLAKVGGLDLAAMCGAYLGAAACGMAAVTDGLISTVAALCAMRLCPAAEKALFASHLSSEPAAAAVLEATGLQAPVRAGLHLGEGSGAVMLLPLLNMALRVYRSGLDFARLGIDAYVPQN